MSHKMNTAVQCENDMTEVKWTGYVKSRIRGFKLGDKDTIYWDIVLLAVIILQ